MVEDCFHIKQCRNIDGSGNALYIEEVYENITVHITSLGVMNKSAGKVAANAVKAYQTFVKSKAAVSPRLVDQLLLPMALAGSSEFTTQSLTNHIQTNIKLIGQFLDRRFHVVERSLGEVLISVK